MNIKDIKNITIEDNKCITAEDNQDITIEDIKNIAVEIDKSTLRCWPNGKTDRVSPPKEKYPQYNAENGILAFSQNGSLYVLPYEKEVAQMLIKSSHFIFNPEMYVPFTNGDYPFLLRFKWHLLLQKEREKRQNLFISDCETFCERNHIKSITHENMLETRCLRIPEKGISVRCSNGDEPTYFPELDGLYLDYLAEQKLGRCNIHNGVCVFVYKNGSTYLTYSARVLGELIQAGYKVKTDFFVPLSNGEVIKDIDVSRKLEELKNYYKYNI